MELDPRLLHLPGSGLGSWQARGSFHLGSDQEVKDCARGMDRNGRSGAKVLRMRTPDCEAGLGDCARVGTVIWALKSE